MKKTALPLLLVCLFAGLYYFVQYFIQDFSSIDLPTLIVGIILDAAFNVVIAFFFGFLILGLLGIACAKLFFSIQLLLSRKRRASEKYIMLKTAGKITGGLLVRRAFLLYCMAISLTLTTLQIIGFLDPGFLANQETFTLLYTMLVFTYAAGMTIILPPIWYLDDVNLMYFTENEGVKYLNPVGQSVLPAIKGFGSFNIIITYLVFVATRFQATANLVTLLDPVLTMFLPIMFLIGFDAISHVGRKMIRAWLVKKGIQNYEEMRIELVKAEGDYKFKVDGKSPEPPGSNILPKENDRAPEKQ
ncbi:MAG: hypothetical protein GYA24_12685 [Candidatus Lokiarchaeota archaeon]|nr:hypothetical protein [Candidatus Lokiarchaeota archaeon]